MDSDYRADDPDGIWIRFDRLAFLRADEREAVEAMKRGDTERLREALDDCLVWLGEARALIAELADDLKGSYEPEKGWPTHIAHAGSLVEDIAQMEADAREALAEGGV